MKWLFSDTKTLFFQTPTKENQQLHTDKVKPTQISKIFQQVKDQVNTRKNEISPV